VLLKQNQQNTNKTGYY